MHTFNFKKYFLNFFGALLISIAIFLIFQVVSCYELIGAFFTNGLIKTVILLAVGSLVVFLLAKAYNDELGRTPFDKLTLKSFTSYDKKDLKLTLILTGISLIAAVGMDVFVYRYIVGNHYPTIDFSYNPFLTFMIVPFVEELLMRGVFFNIAYDFLDMKNKVVRNIAIVVNILMFLSMHYVPFNFTGHAFVLSLLVASLPRLVISCSLTYIYVKTKDIKYNILMHMIYNFLALTLIAKIMY